jgi:hypothetical protein
MKRVAGCLLFVCQFTVVTHNTQAIKTGNPLLWQWHLLTHTHTLNNAKGHSFYRIMFLREHPFSPGWLGVGHTKTGSKSFCES